MLWMVVGLGNPGKRYEGTRHNAGFLVVDRLAERWGIDCSKAQLGALVGSGLVRGQRTVLVKPQGFMNRSGHPTRSLMGWYGVQAEQVLVVHDDLDIDFGQLRIKRSGGHGGHNGLRDLHQHLGGGDYPRVRVGIGRTPQGWETADYVLSRFAMEQQEHLPGLLDRAADAVEVVLTEGVEAAMNTFHVRERRERKPAEKLPDDTNPSLALGAAGVC